VLIDCSIAKLLHFSLGDPMAKRRSTYPQDGIVRNYGLFWNRDYVNWGRNGVLYGYRRGVGWVKLSRQIGIYILYDKDFVPVYIGQTGKGQNRMYGRIKAHMNDQHWNRWQHFSWFGFLPVVKGSKKYTFEEAGELDDSQNNRQYTLDTVVALKLLEGILIAGTEPVRNRRGAEFEDLDILEFRQLLDDDSVGIRSENIPNQLKVIATQLERIRESLS
jgi:hypothetical protein